MSIRRALLAGFGAVFLLAILSAYGLVKRLEHLEREAAAIHARYAQAEDLLVRVRGQVLDGSVYLRDVALQVDPDTMRSLRERLRQTRADTDDAMARYLPEVNSDVELTHWERLQGELDGYWDTLSTLLGGRRSAALDRARTLLRDDAWSRQQAVLSISTIIRELNQEAYGERRVALATLYSTLRRDVWMTTVAMVLLGVLIAVGSMSHAGRLEARIRQQHRQELEHKLVLQDLSARLVGAQEEERRHIARDLHDEVGQALTAVKIELAAVERDLAASHRVSAVRLTNARAITDGTLQTIRDLSRLLHPSVLDDFGLVETLRWYVRGFAKRTGVHAQVVADDLPSDMSPEFELCIYRIVQEALTNVARHAEAVSCRVSLEERAGALTLSIEDDGRGISPEQASGRSGAGLGLIGIRERAARFGGVLSAGRKHANRGTSVVVRFPLDGAKDQTSMGETQRTVA